VSSLRQPVRNHPAVAYILGGVIGGTVGLLFAAAALEEGTFSPSATVFHPSATVLGSLAPGAAATLGGVLAGWFVVALTLAWAPGRIRCPRCGTSNERGITTWTACQMPLG
jgi:hypothetical protein